MNTKDDSGEIISKKMLDWLTGITSLAAALSTIFSAFLSDEKKPLAYGIAFLLVIVSGGIVVYQRRRAAKLKIAESQEPLSATAALRGLLPFEEGDELPGRARDVQEIYTLVASSTFRFGVLWGESGCGKTSLLRAGLTPKLRNEKFIPLYINKPTKDPQEAIRSALLKEVQGLEKRGDKNLKGLLKAAAPKGKKIIILFDQFEEFFLTNRTPSSRAGFVKWLGEAVKDENLPVAFLLGIRADFFAQLQNFAPQIPEPTSTRSTYQLQNFDSEQAKQIFGAAAKADGILFELELIQAVIKELEAEDFIRPAELQVVGTRLKRKNITRLSQYEALGGARGILSSYINEEIKQSANEQAARLVLRLMCADAVETKSPTDLDMDDILRGVSGSGKTDQLQNNVKQAEIQKILNQFVTARVLIHTDEDKYNLAHDYLAPYVRTATEGTETNTERANRMLKRYVAEYKEDKRTRIPFGRIRLIQKYSSPEVKGKAQELINKSRRAIYTLFTALAIPFIVLLGLYFFYLTQAYYFSIDNSYVVLRAGSPQFTFLPAFGKVVIQTDIKEVEVDPEFRETIIRGEVTGFWFEKTEYGYQRWGDQLFERLGSTYSYSHTLRWLHRSNTVEENLVSSLVDPQIDWGMRFSRIQALDSLTLARPEIFTAYAIQTLIDTLSDPKADRFLRSAAAHALGRVAQAKPEFVTADMFQTLMTIITNPQTASDLRSAATDALSSFAQAKPKFISSSMFQTLIDILNDPQAEPALRSAATQALGQIVQARPEFISSSMFQTLIDILNDPQAEPALRSAATQALGQIVQARPEFISSRMFQTLIDILIASPDFSNFSISTFSTYAYALLRFSAAETLGPFSDAKPEMVTSETIQNLIKIASDPKADNYARASATLALQQLALANPEAVSPEMLQSLTAIFNDPEANLDARSAAVQTFAQLARAKPEAITPEMLQNLVVMFNDSKENLDFGARAYAARTLVQFAPAIKPELISSDLFQILIDISTDSDDLSTAQAVGQFARARPDLVTSDMLQSLLDSLKSSQLENHFSPSPVPEALGELAKARPEFVTSYDFQILINILGNHEADSIARSDAAQAFAQLSLARPEAVSLEIIQTLISILKSDLDRPGRSAAAYALFGITLGTNEQQDVILNELEDMQADPQPQWRMSASQTLEMIAIGDLIEEARSEPKRIGSIKSRLNDLIGLPSYVEEHLPFAAQIVLKEIEKLEPENK